MRKGTRAELVLLAYDVWHGGGATLDDMIRMGRDEFIARHIAARDETPWDDFDAPTDDEIAQMYDDLLALWATILPAQSERVH